MDSITHIVLGATIGEAIAGKQLGKKAMLIGAIAQSIPDIDFIGAIWLRPVDNLLVHRGFTHSIFFATLLVLLVGFIASKRSSEISLTRWILFFAVELSVHLLLDSLNNYGVGWFEPFFHHRIAFNIIYVVDPFYSLWIGIGCTALLVLPMRARSRKTWTSFALIISSLYLVYALFNKFSIGNDTRVALKNKGWKTTRIFTSPTPLNNWLWFIAVEADSGYYIAHRSVLDKDDSIDFNYFPRQVSLLKELKDKEDLNKLVRFSQGYYTIQKYHDGLLFNDLRFGQIAGWSDPYALFAFHYDLYHPDANLFVVQQGRFSNWDKETVSDLLKRIAGNKPVHNRQFNN